MKLQLSLTMTLVSLMAAPVAAAEPAAGDAPRWSMGAGVGFSLFSSYDGLRSGSSLAAASSWGAAGMSLNPGASSLYGYSSSSPRLALAVERRLRAADWLMVELDVNRGERAEHNSPREESYRQTLDAETIDSGYSATVGLRHVFTPGGAIEVGAYFGVGFTRSQNRRDETVRNYTSSEAAWEVLSYQGRYSAWGLGATAGVTLERELVSGLAVRLATSLVGVEYLEETLVRRLGEAPEQTDTASDLGYGLALAPSLQLRAIF